MRVQAAPPIVAASAMVSVLCAVAVQVNRLLAMTNLKTYFAVDTTYVLKKLSILLFPFSHRNWMLYYDQSGPVAPRQDINAPDLYIPGMLEDRYIH